jgi:DNA-binding transcriptional MerR regulator
VNRPVTPQGYRIREFAARAGVTVKTLHHYDRLGLLKPHRTASRYRLYSVADLTRLREILALKFLGLPLGRIRQLLAPGAPPLHEALRQQREVLEVRRRLLDRAIQALGGAETGLEAAPGGAAEILQALITVIGMQDSVDEMRRYYTDEAWAAWKHSYEDWPSPEWQALYRDVNAALDAEPSMDPAGADAQALGSRWLALDRGQTAASAVRTGLRKAWADREHWPPALKARLATFRADRAMRFVNTVLWERWEAERLARERGGAPAPARVSDARCDLYCDCARALRDDGSRIDAASFVSRWKAILEAETGGDQETQADMIRARRGRHTWPPGLTRYTASLYGVDPDTWLQVTDFLENALDSPAPGAA